MQIHQLGDLAENLSQALLATIVFSARQRKKATVSNARSISKVNDLDLETTLGKVNCAPPDCLEGADKTADLLARRLANIMKVGDDNILVFRLNKCWIAEIRHISTSFSHLHQ